MPKPPPTWRYSVGQKALSRVTVYERRDRPAFLYYEYHELTGKRRQRALRYVTDVPVPNTVEGREFAVLAAKRLSEERERLAYAELADVYGVAAPRTVDDLLARLEDDKSDGWSEAYKRDQARFRAFWSRKIGGLSLRRVNASMIHQIAKDAGRSKKKKWSPRTLGSYLRYIVDAFSYGERKLKWIEARDNLSAVDIPAPRSKGREYSLDEIRALLPALEAADPRAGWIGHVAWQTGRRLSAIRTLRKKDVLSADGKAVLRFPGETDKAGRDGEAVVVGRAAELTAQMMAKPGAYVLGTKPPSVHLCEDWLIRAEDSAKIVHQKHRAWHGIKRTFVTVSDDLRVASKQSGTRQSTLATIYDKPWTEGKEGLAKAMSERATAPTTATKAPKSKKRKGS